MTISRRTVGRSMIVIGVAGIIVSLLSVFVGQRLIGQVEASLDDSLLLTTEALDAVVDSVQLTSQIVDTVQSGLREVNATTATLQSSIAQASKALSDSGKFVGGPLPDALAAVNDVLPTIKSIANSIDDALRLASRAPFGPRYNPKQPFDQAIGDLATALRPLPAQLRRLSGQFNALTTSGATLATQLTALGTQLTQLDGELTQVAGLVDRYRNTAEEARTLAARSRSRLDSDTGTARVLLIVVGLIFAAGQVVPIWLGAALLQGDAVIGGRKRRPND